MLFIQMDSSFGGYIQSGKCIKILQMEYRLSANILEPDELNAIQLLVKKQIEVDRDKLIQNL